MTTPLGLPPRALGGARWPNAAMRVSDADRAEVADRLARHYSEGRLDDAELELRLDRAMRAKTGADLLALLADLPDGQVNTPPNDPGTRVDRRRQRELFRMQLERERLLLRQQQREHRRQERELHWLALRPLPVIVLAIVLAVIVGHALREIFSIWVVIGVLVFVWLRRGRRGPQGR